VHESAKLVSSDGSAGQGPGAAATFSSQTIATGGLDGGADAAYVFTEPAIGWSGTLHENAKLTAVSDVPGAPAGPVPIQSIAISGPTIVAGARGSAYVFSEASGGWSSGTHSATLSPSVGSALGSFGPVAVSGRTVVADPQIDAQAYSRGVLYVFAQPVGGWSSETEAARLSATDGAQFGAVAISGPSIFAGTSSGAVNVFVEPAKGWHRIIHQRATLTYPAPAYGAGPSVAISGRTAAEVDYDDHYFCPCNGVLHTYIEPPSGWAGKQSATGAVDVNVSAAGNDVAVPGNTVFFGAPDGVHVLQTVGPPNATRLKLSRLASNKPGLRLTLQAGASAPLIKSFAIGLAGGLSYDPRLARVAHGTTIAGGGRYSLSIARGKLLVRLAKPEGRLTIAVAGRALVESGALLTRVRDVLQFNPNRRNRHRQTLTLTVGVLLTDAANHTTSTVAQVSIR
jgi:hypothetical protein